MLPTEHGGRNIFRGPFQSRLDFSVVKLTKLPERLTFRYDAQFFNIFNHPSFDTPNNNVTFNPCFNPNRVTSCLQRSPKVASVSSNTRSEARASSRWRYISSSDQRG